MLSFMEYPVFRIVCIVISACKYYNLLIYSFHFVIQERGHDYYNGMTKEQFKKMQEFIGGRVSSRPSSKL